ncbi:MAG TPA: choice-of-anchor tandem repeat GloVer-containing protein [Rhizomicrobium sp.]|nr:choice-of-anchor tandem repeat GloVer-containing protein [Rhizomicrobium sp.]
MRIFAYTALAASLSLAAAIWSTQASAVVPIDYRVLHTFCHSANCGDGQQPIGLTIDAEGDLFGVAVGGGRFGAGTLYELAPQHHGKHYTLDMLKELCNPDFCTAGNTPTAAPIMDGSGNLYGTTESARQQGCGAIYMKSSPPQFHVLHVFQGADGCNATSGSLVYQGKQSGQAYDGVSPLYGMTENGGSNSSGVVYELTPPKPGRKKWSERVIYSFCQISDCADGTQPVGNLVMDANGDLFGGTTDGTIFEMTPDGNGGFNHHILYISGTGESFFELALASDGTTLYGVSAAGGTGSAGTLFKLTPNTCRACGARLTTYQYTLLHTFCSGGGNCTDGHGPAALLFDQQGDIFGVTAAGGANAAPPQSGTTGGGTVFEYTHTGSFGTLYNFCAQANCTDGGRPIGGLLLNNGALFGTTANGGSTTWLTSGAGVVFELMLP